MRPLQLHNPQDILQTLASRLRDQRLRLEWRQQTLAERSGVSLPTVKRIEATGQTTLLTFLKLAHALGRLDEFEGLLAPPIAETLDDLEARRIPPGRKRGTR